MRTDFQVSLQPYNTFGIDSQVDKLITLEKSEDLRNLSQELHNGFIIGGGSNILLTKPRYEVAFLNRIKGIEVVDEDRETVIIAVGSGENWHELVLWTLSHHYGGLENLSLIPGTVGAAPIQNIGAYGVEVKDVFAGLDYFRYEDHHSLHVSATQCLFGYRDSIFKNEWKDKGFIEKVYLRLTKENHRIQTEYKALNQFLHEHGWTHPTIHQISQAVIAIRQSKLPDWRKIGNAGSFFKNPVIDRSVYDDLISQYTRAPSYPVDDQHVKIPAAWLIQEAGFKGQRTGQVGSYELQPLVLVNYGGATGAELVQLKNTIQAEVHRLFGIYLTPEVTII